MSSRTKDIALLALAAGVAWGTTLATLNGKVDAQTYREDQARRATLDTTMARDIRAIRLLLCREQPTDSYCQLP